MAEATQGMVAVMQDDREAAAELVAWHNKAASDWKTDGGNDLTFFAADMPEAIRRGAWDSHDVVQAFARRRRNVEAGLIRSLRHDFDEWPDYVALADVADALESAHLKEQSA